MPGLKSQAPCADEVFSSPAWRRRKVAIGKSLGERSFGLLAMQLKALGLLVFFVPVQAQPLQPFKDAIAPLASVLRSTSVRQGAAPGRRRCGAQRAIQDKGTGAADVQEPGGRGSNGPAMAVEGGGCFRHRISDFLSTMLAFALPVPASAETRPGVSKKPLGLRWKRRRWRRIRLLRLPIGLGRGITFQSEKAST